MAAALVAAQFASAQEHKQTVQEFLNSLHYQTGTVAVRGAHSTLALNEDFRYLDAADAQRVLEQLWGNPPDSSVLGMLVPAKTPLGEHGAWAVVITYSDDGHVSDADAAKIDYTQMLKDMQASAHDANAERIKAGYDSVEIVGWAAPPHYDSASNKLYWAKEIEFGGKPRHTLNYDIRILGRGGYLSLNAISSMDQLPMVQDQMQKVLTMTNFDAGQRYADFNASTDKIAAYGIGALVAGTLAAKAGLFAKLLALLIAFKKAIVVGFLAAVAAVKKLFSRRST